MKKIKNDLMKKLLISFIVNALFSIANLILSIDIVLATEIPMIISVLLAIFTPILTQAATIVAMAVISYFIGAALGTEFDIKKFMKLSAYSLLFFPITTASNTLGYLIIGKTFISFGLIGLLSFIPFYILTSLIAYKCLPIILNETNKKKNTAISILMGVAAIALTIPG